MKIVSNFQDYYDKMMSYGIDKNITFNRISNHNMNFNLDLNFNYTTKDKFKLSTNLEEYCENYDIYKFFLPFIDYRYYITKENKYLDYAIVSINGKLFMDIFVCDINTQKISNRNMLPEDLFDFIKDNFKSHRYGFSYTNKKPMSDITFEEFCEIYNKRDKYYYETNKEEIDINTKLLELHKKYENPILFFKKNRFNEYSLEKNIPLRLYGFKNVFNGDVEQLYQEISYCIGNVIQNKNNPPETISDKVKIQQHGFNNQSFKHRK